MRRALRKLAIPVAPKDVPMYCKKVKGLTWILVLLCLALWQVSAGCGGGGSGSSLSNPPPPPPPPASNPVPAIISLSPNQATVGGVAFTLTVTGQNFVSSSAVWWNGVAIPTTFVTSSELQAQITAADIASAGSASVSVTTPMPGGGNSGPAEFTINPTSNPQPSLTSFSPFLVYAGAPGFILTLGGTNFIPASTIAWNGVALPTTYLSATQLETQVPASNVAVSGLAEITVLNPAPGGGASAPVVFTIAYSPMVVSQLTNDLVWDSTHQVICLSIPSLALTYGNTVATLDPTTGIIQSSAFAGSEPDMLAISDDDQYLYVALDGSSSVQRFTLPNLSTDIDYSLGAVPSYGPAFAVGLQVAPSLPHTVAVSRGAFNVSPYALGGIAVYDDAVQRPTVANTTGPLYDSLQWGSDTSIYANNAEVSSFDFYVLTANSNGVVQSQDYPNEFSSFYISIHYDSGTGLVYGDDGTVLNPTNGQHVGAFEASGLMVPDSTINSAFFLGQTAAQVGTSSFTIESFNLTTFAPVAEIVVPNVAGNPQHFIRWGTNGLAFSDDAGYVYILSSSFVTPEGTQLVTPPHYLSPVANTRLAPKIFRISKSLHAAALHRPFKNKTRSADSVLPNPAPTASALSPNVISVGDDTFTLTVTGSNFVSLSILEWNGSPRPTEFVSTSQLQAQIGSADVGTAGSDSVTVYTPGPGGGNSNPLLFTVVSQGSSLVPTLQTVSPNNAAVGTSGLTLNVIGSNFDASSVALWNGTPQPTTFLDSGLLQVQVSASDLATGGFAQVAVSNSEPGGGTSNALSFEVFYQSTIVNQVANDIAWDPLNQVIYLSVPSSAATYANQVCILNPASATITTCQSAGTEPDVLAISDDSQFLYVGQDGTGTVQRLLLPALTPDISYSLGNYDNGAPYYALDLQVAPGAPHTSAVTKGVMNLDPAADGGIAIYDDATPRPATMPGWGSPGGKTYDTIQWGADASVLYAANTETGMDFYTLNVTPSGVALSEDYPAVFWNPGRIHYDSGVGLIYSDDGFHAVDPSTGLPSGIFEVGGEAPMAPDSALNTVFILAKYASQEASNYTIDLFDMTHYVPIAKIPFSTTQGGLTHLGRFIRWGTNGLALNDTAGNIYLISGPFLNANSQSQSPTYLTAPSSSLYSLRPTTKP